MTINCDILEKEKKMDYLDLLTGIVLGFILCLIFVEVKVCGVLKVDRHSMDRPIWQFSFYKDFDSIQRKKKIILKVDPNADLRNVSQDSQVL